MGCDYFYRGSLNDHRLQGKVVQLVAQFWSDEIWIHHEPEALHRTKIEGDSRMTEEKFYPFNFFGFVPFTDSDFMEHGQMVFDRTDGGRLVTFSKLPAVYEIEGMNSNENLDRETVISVKRGGYFRGSASYRVGLLFCVIKKRYFHDLWVGDDDDVFNETEYLVDRLRIADVIMNESLTFNDCCDLFETAHEKYRAKRARRKGAQEWLTRIKEAGRRRLQGEDHGKPTIVNPIRSLGNIYAETAALLKAESTAEKSRSNNDMQEER
jgi:hypothetical protein